MPPLYLDPDQSLDARTDDLLARMSLEEKIAQLDSAWVYELLDNETWNPAKVEKTLAHGIGQISRVGGASSLRPRDSARLANRIQRYLREETRLGIPAIIHEECCSGYMARDATIFPHIIGLASTWEPELTRAMASVLRTQMRAVGAQLGLSPVLDIARDPRWGRVEETFGEDPHLTSEMGLAYVRGLQGEDWREGVVATAKHFAGHGLPEGGMNWAPPHIPPREFREVYLRPFERVVREAGLMSVMATYHELDGVPSSASKELLSDVLREEWGFEGIVVSDYFSIDQLQHTHRVSGSKEESAKLALEAGIDVELPTVGCYGEVLLEAVRAGRIDEALVDRSVRRILRLKFMLGLFEDPFVDEELAPTLFDTPDQRALARTIARKSIVLLKNEDVILPLGPDLGRLAVIGPNAHSLRNLLGDYSYPSHVEALLDMKEGAVDFDTPVPDVVELEDIFPPMQTVLDAIRARVPTDTDVLYAQGCDVLDAFVAGFDEAVAAARNADVALLVLGDKSGLVDSCSCGEARDVAELDLPGVQQQLAEAVIATGTPTVVILVTGRPYAIAWLAEHAQAILQAWLPGEEGAGAIVDVLFGDENPGGKLPITMPRISGQIPIYYRHKPSGGRSHWKGAYVDVSNEPLYPFGYGLGYTSFRLSNLRISPDRARMGEVVDISVDVANMGERAGDEVVQLYVRDVVASVTRPVKSLQGFRRLHLAAGERQTVGFSLAVGDLAFYDRDMRLAVEPGEFEIMVGTSSADLPLQGRIEVM